MRSDPTTDHGKGASGSDDLALNRRNAIRIGAAGLAGLAGAGVTFPFLSKLWNSAAPADIFKRDAPNQETWQQWQERGWVKEASHYLKLGQNTQCKVCPNNCLLAPGDRSHCRNKVNHQGTLYTLAYANPCTFHVDPVEKKPLFHFLPGSMTFSLATSGCVFRCLNCQNWDISQKKPEETKEASGASFRLQAPLPTSLTLSELRRLSLFPEDLAGISAALGCPSVSYTYSEPTSYYEYVSDCCKQTKARKIRNVIVTCGSIEERPLRDLLDNVDAAHIDLKGFDEETYRKLNSGKLETILNTLRVYRSAGVWFEIINLVVPTYTDNLEKIRRMCGWIAQNLGPDVPLHFSRFHPQHKLAYLPPTPVDTLLRAREIGREAGLRYVYIGNVPGLADAGATHCPNCKRIVVERDIYAVTSIDIENGRCKFCQAKVAGTWSV